MNPKKISVDIILVAVLLASAVAIGITLVRRGKPKEPAPPVVANQVGTSQGFSPQQLLEEVGQVSNEDFAKIAAGPIAKFSVKESTGCATSPLVAGISVIQSGLGQKISSEALQFLLGFKRPRCFRVGETFKVYLFDPAPSAKVVQLVGSVRVKYIFSMQPRDVPAELLTALSLSKARYLEVAEFKRPGDFPDVIVRFEEFKPSSQSDLAAEGLPTTAPRVEVISWAAAEEMLRQNRSVLLVDVRSPEESTAVPLNRISSRSIPFVMKNPKLNQFSWDVLNSERLESEFDLRLIQVDQSLPIIVVGSNARDARALYALLKLYEGDFRNLFWIQGGAEARLK